MLRTFDVSSLLAKSYGIASVERYESVISRVRQIVMAIINDGGDARIVGGAVRSILTDSYPVHDIDIASSLSPDDNVAAIKKWDSSTKIIMSGVKYGTISLLYNGEIFEITSLREDQDCDGRHASVIYGSDWSVDAHRRDFTINAMSIDINGKLYDYCDGLSDLNNGIVRFINDPEVRISEDYLRILRYFRFLCYYGVDAADADTLNTISKLSNNISNLSSERIRSELWKILSCVNATAVLQLMCTSKVMDAILHYLALPVDCVIRARFMKNEPLLNFVALLSLCKCNDSNLLKLKEDGLLLKKEYSCAKKMLALLRGECVGYSEYNGEFTKLVDAVMNTVDVALDKHMQLSYLIGHYEYTAFIKLCSILERGNFNGEDRMEYYFSCSRGMHDDKMKCPVDGHDLKNNVVDKRDIKYSLGELRLRWVLSNFTLSRDDLLAYNSR